MPLFEGVKIKLDINNNRKQANYIGLFFFSSIKLIRGLYGLYLILCKMGIIANECLKPNETFEQTNV